MDNPYQWLQEFLGQVPGLLQPVIVAAAAFIPYIEGAGAAALGVLAGINPVTAALAAIAGNLLCVIGVVLLGERVRARLLRRRAERTVPSPPAEPAATPEAAGTLPAAVLSATPKPGHGSRGRTRLRRWVLRFGVPGASILAPAVLPTMLTAAFFIGTGVPRGWVILWQAIAIILWTAVVTILTTGALSLLGW